MVRNLIKIVAVALLAGSIYAGKASKLYEEAKRLETKSRYKEALRVLQQALLESPSRREKFEILIEMADIELFFLGKPEDALAHLLDAKASYPPQHRKLDEVYYRLGVVYEKLGDFIEAAKNYEIIATKYRKSKYFEDALQGVERAFRKNFKEYVAIVGGEPITKLEFDARLEEIPAFFREKYETKEGQRELLEKMIDEALLVKEAERRKIYLKSKVRERIERQRRILLGQALYDEEVKGKVKVSEAEMRQYYLRNKDKFMIPANVDIQRIVVRKRKEAEEILSLIKKGVPFDSLVYRSVSPEAARGGYMRGLRKDTRHKEIVEVAFRLKKGEISDIILLPDSTYAIIKLIEKRKERTRPFEEVRDEIERTLKEEKQKRLWTRFKLELRKKYGVKYREDIEEETSSKMKKLGLSNEKKQKR